LLFALLRERLKTAKIQLEYKTFIPAEENSVLRLERTIREGNSHFFGTSATQKYTFWGELDSFFSFFTHGGTNINH
jgi:hypothetical protein